MNEQPTTCGARRAGDAFPGCIREPGHPGYHHEQQADRDVSWLDNGEWYVYHRDGRREAWDGSHIHGKSATVDLRRMEKGQALVFRRPIRPTL